MTLEKNPNVYIARPIENFLMKVVRNIREMLRPSDVRFWIFLFFAGRLAGITQAPLEAGHSWRQSLTAMIARNFLQIDPNILYPRIDMAGDATGIIGAEFPLFNYLIYFFAVGFGYEHWYGRLINLVVSSLGVYCFHGLVAAFFTKRTALAASVILLGSIWFSFSRKIMPDTFSVSLVLMGLYAGYRYLQSGNLLAIAGYTLLVAAGTLCKIPAAALVAVIGVLPFIPEVSRGRKALLIGATLIAGVITAWWYFYWIPDLIDRFGYRLYFPKGLREGVTEILPLLPEYFKKFYFSGLYSYIGFAAAVAGVVFLFASRRGIQAAALLLVTGVFIAFTAKTGAVFPTHNYYIIPFVPVLALLAALGLERLPPKMAWIAIGLILVESTANQLHDFFPKEGSLHKPGLESLMDAHVEKDALIVINGGASPQDIYFANRRGWTVDNALLNPASLDSLRSLGADYVVIDRREFDGEMEGMVLLEEREGYGVWRYE